MCIRYELDFERIAGGSRKLDFQELLGMREGKLEMFPVRRAPMIWGQGGRAEIVEAEWGFTPFWAKTPKFGRTSGYNARSETVWEKPTWRTAIRAQRCILPATGFYERVGIGAEMRWRRFRHVDGLFPIAGLYEPPNQHCDVPTFALVTTLPNEVVEEAHDRMPVILSPEDIGRWLDPATPAEELQTLMIPCSEDWLIWEDTEFVRRGQRAAEE